MDVSTVQLLHLRPRFPLLWSERLNFPQICMLKPNHEWDGTRRYGLWETLNHKGASLKDEINIVDPLLLLPCGDKVRVCDLQNENRPITRQ